MHLFENMDFGQAVFIVQLIGVAMNLLFLSLLVGAMIAIRRGKRNQPGRPLLFPRLVFYGWFVILAAGFAYFFTGAWYGENGPPPQEVAEQAAVALAFFAVIVVAIHVGLYRSMCPKHPDQSKASAPCAPPDAQAMHPEMIVCRANDEKEANKVLKPTRPDVTTRVSAHVAPAGCAARNAGRR